MKASVPDVACGINKKYFKHMKITIQKLVIAITLCLFALGLSNCGKPVDSIIEGTWTQETFTTDSIKIPEIWEFTEDQHVVITNVSNEKGRIISGVYSLTSKGFKSFLNLSEFGDGLDGKYLVEKFSSKRLILLRRERLDIYLGEGESKTDGAYIRRELYK